MTDLFDMDAVKQDSPRLAWIKKHGVITHYFQSANDWIAGLREMREDFPNDKCDTDTDILFFETGLNGKTRIGIGNTEEEAIAALAAKWGIPLWNEEESAP